MHQDCISPFHSVKSQKNFKKNNSLYKYDLLVPSVVPVWKKRNGYFSMGGFPIQINALTEIFVIF